jgi:hypothetical protein
MWCVQGSRKGDSFPKVQCTKKQTEANKITLRCFKQTPQMSLYTCGFCISHQQSAISHQPYDLFQKEKRIHT